MTKVEISVTVKGLTESETVLRRGQTGQTACHGHDSRVSMRVSHEATANARHRITSDDVLVQYTCVWCAGGVVSV